MSNSLVEMGRSLVEMDKNSPSEKRTHWVRNERLQRSCSIDTGLNEIGGGGGGGGGDADTPKIKIGDADEEASGPDTPEMNIRRYNSEVAMKQIYNVVYKM